MVLQTIEERAEILQAFVLFGHQNILVVRESLQIGGGGVDVLLQLLKLPADFFELVLEDFPDSHDFVGFVLRLKHDAVGTDQFLARTAKVNQRKGVFLALVDVFGVEVFQNLTENIALLADVVRNIVQELAGDYLPPPNLCPTHRTLFLRLEPFDEALLAGKARALRTEIGLAHCLVADEALQQLAHLHFRLQLIAGDIF